MKHQYSNAVCMSMFDASSLLVAIFILFILLLLQVFDVVDKERVGVAFVETATSLEFGVGVLAFEDRRFGCRLAVNLELGFPLTGCIYRDALRIVDSLITP